MSDTDEHLDALLRDAYRAVPVGRPDLEERVLARLRERRTRSEAVERAATVAVEPAPPAHRHPPGPLTRWAMRCYWLVTAILAVALVARTAAATPGPAALAFGGLAAAVLLVGTAAVTRSTGRSTARLILGSL